MPRSRNLTNYLQKKEKSGVEVGLWAIPDMPGVAKFRYCHSTHDFLKGVSALISHSETQKHVKNTPKDDTTKQLTLLGKPG